MDGYSYKFTFEDGSEALMHHGTKGMKWGVWNSETSARYRGHGGKSSERLFVSGSSKTQDKESGYYRKKLPRDVRTELKKSMRKGDEIIVGDAPGVDRQVQDYLSKKRYKNVSVYGPDVEPRYKAERSSSWRYNPTYNPKESKHEKGSKEWLADKDVAMTNASTKGLAVILDDGANATRRNVERLRSQGKDAVTFVLSGEGKRKDHRVDSRTVRSS